MSLIFERFQTDGIAELSYLVGDDETGTAAVFDPTVDVEKYLSLARDNKLSITHIFETHIHADLVSGARELRERTGLAKIYVSHEGGAQYGFEHEGVKDGDSFEFGDTRVTVKHTPGHTPEHVSYVLSNGEGSEGIWGVLTGDSLFVDSAGRPDLLGSGETEELTRKLFETLRGFYLKLDDGVAIFPAHGSGSPCGAEIGDRLQSTIGYERRSNPYLQLPDFESFRDKVLSGVPPVPTYYPRMKKINAQGPEILRGPVPVAALPVEAFREAVEKGAGVLVDTRTMLGFGGAHIPGALNLGGTPILSIWAGWLLDPEKPLLLVLESDAKLDEVVTLFLRTGYRNFAGYLTGGMGVWNNAGNKLAHVPQISVHELQERAAELQIIDVRSRGEWKKGHIPGAKHCFLPELREKCGAWDKKRPVAVYCASGYRASIASSILKQEGFADVSNVPGSWQAWKNAGLPVEQLS
ncbi:MBL fold metallo-hydrolase [Luteolibacter arcticus]|uniref:MBL fold metallo-hydrolase n=1 Tax=Luteolibacter arcticus TaxID=1581411 RepID=A0ABT3GHY2_9BACT|nr:MBL fold metallo-hydrolase [Luteolibacter arcticus]MCW1923109.1 MBL fold metallo-hydrolase [Luteolibacter arcticus]